MRKTAGFLLVLLIAALAIITISSGDETDSSHLVHLTADYGPQITCNISCHSVDENNDFVEFLDSSPDLANTTVCDACHSPGGVYNGVDDLDIGAKTNWDTGVFNGSELAAGKEKWCLGCHDDDPAVVNGVSAPNIAGDDTSYGFYKTGHGKHGNEQAITCLACHDSTATHVDGEVRTYTAAADNYQVGYRLKSVDGEAPLDVPRIGNDFTAEQFRLCFSCHESTPFLDMFNMNTNFRRDVNDSCAPSLYNIHRHHLKGRPPELSNIWDSDWDGENPGDSINSCPACHNVHGPRHRDGASHAPAMIRTGELIGRSSSLNLDYFTSECPDRTLSATNETLDSTGGVMKFYGPGCGSVTKNGVCYMCHGDARPYWREAKDILSCGSGNCHTSGSHDAHLNAENGPLIASCDVCHDINNFPQFSDGEDLANTAVCDTCHSPGGTYNGVNDLIVGAKDNWEDGVYEYFGEDLVLKYGKEKWCVGCHDDGDSSINQGSEIDGVIAPNIAGDEDNSAGEGIYGGWGYYKTGHGLPGDEPYSYKGGFLDSPLKPGASRAVECDACHDFSTVHIDGEPRTFDDSNSADTDPSVYRLGYRLSLVNGDEPMQIPWQQNDLPNEPDTYKLCAECHLTRPFTGGSKDETNFISTSSDGTRNRHYTHMIMPQDGWWSPDWEVLQSVNTSRIICVTCHNVHGSTQLAMVRDGKLINREPGLKVWYYNEDTTQVDQANSDPPDPEDTPLAASDGSVRRAWTSRYLCNHCHGNNNTIKEPWEPFQERSVAPTLDWTAETGFEFDGANPDSAVSGSSFTFRVKYTNINNDAPTVMQVWVDEDDGDGTYEESEKHNLTKVGSEETYYDGEIYTYTILSLDNTPNIKPYRFYATNTPDGPATGSPTQNNSVYVFDASSGGGNAPTLNWTAENGYTTDGIDPDSGSGCRTSFTFRVDYSDESSPALIQVWIDEDGNGAYSSNEKFDMTEDTPGNRYTLTRVLNYDGDGTLNFRFYATDGILEATGDPTVEQSASLTNCIPILSWTGETNYIGDGVDPGTGQGGSDFTFRVKYTDDDNIAPDPIQVWVDTDNSSTYDVHEKYTMDEVDTGDADCTTAGNGKFYTITLPVPKVGDGNITYRFYASDGADVATGAPVSDTDLIITAASAANNAPVLSWTTADCLDNGARPGVGAEQEDFEFKVIYTDDDNECASDILVLIDEDDSGTYESEEKYLLTEADEGDTDCDDGKLYETTLSLVSAGDGDLNYSFYATDGNGAATGIPVESDSMVTVIDDPIKVRPSGGAGWLTTIQSAEDGSITGSTIVVYPNDGFTAATYVENIEALTVNLTIRSACGPDLTIIDGGGSGVGVLLRADDQVLDGFSVTNAANAIYVNPGPDNVTIKNNKIYGNSGPYGAINVNNGFNVHIENNEIYNNTSTGIRANAGSTLDISNCDIHHNTTTGWGGGIFFNGGTHSITDTLIRENSGGDGGGIVFNSATATMTNTTISNNEASSRGGGMYFTSGGSGSHGTFDKCTITNNQAPSGGGIYTQNASDPVFKNSIFADNEAYNGGGAVYNHSGNPLFINDTFAYNTTPAYGGVFRACVIGQQMVVRNSLFWGNTAETNGNIGSRYGCNGNGPLLFITDSFISDSLNGKSNFYHGTVDLTDPDNIFSASDPLFAGDGNYHITSGSPVIDQASDAYAPADDIDGDARPMGAADDMGADEYDPPPVENTEVGTATAVQAGDTSIDVILPYTGDDNGNNTYTVEYKLSSSGTWLDWGTNPKAHSASPYTNTISGLTAGETYDVRLTYNDADGVNGTNPQVVNGIVLLDNTTFVGSATAFKAGDTSIDISMPYTGDDNGDNFYTVEYKLSSSGTWLDWLTNPKAHSASPFTDTITGLTAGETYDVRLTYNDADGVFGSAELLFVVDLSLPIAVAYWKFDETSGVTAYDSIGSNDATVINAVCTSSCKCGYALSFDGDDYVEVPDSGSLDITEELTIELWFKPEVTYDATLTDYLTLLDASDGADSYFLGINANGKLHMGSYGGNIQSTQASWEAGTWYHVVGTYRDVGGTYSGELYVNGVAETLSVDNYDNMAGSEYVGIGGSGRFIKFNGIIDEVVIYNRTLTPSEVLDRYNLF